MYYRLLYQDGTTSFKLCLRKDAVYRFASEMEIVKPVSAILKIKDRCNK